MPNKYYTREYFITHDYLDLHVAHSLKIFMNENGLNKVLDVGCGTGKLVKFLNRNGFQAFGCDKEPIAVILAQKINKRKTIIRGKATRLPYRNNSFDLVTGISIIEHLSNNEANKFLKEAGRVLKPQGYLFLITPNYASIIRLIQGRKWFAYRDPTHKIYYSPGSLSRSLTESGFINTKQTFKINKKIIFNWHLPVFLRKFPQRFQYLVTFFLVSLPLYNIRDKIWIAGQKPKNQ